jgi:hypothetical protein
MQLYAVINGDIIGSTSLSNAKGEFYLTELKKLFDELLKGKKAFGLIRSIEVYRGDSFQCAMDKPEKSLRILLLIRSYLRMISSRYVEKGKKRKLLARTSRSEVTDIRIAVGLGEISRLAKRLLESDGEAFHRSGRLLDSLKKSGQNMAIISPWEDWNRELDVFCVLLDTIISRWSPQQSEVIHYKLKGFSQTQIANKLQTSISAVNQRLRTANWNAVDKVLSLFEYRVTKNMK